MDPSIIVNLRPYKTAKAMWDYPKKMYNQNSSAQWFQLEYEMSNDTQENLPIYEY